MTGRQPTRSTRGQVDIMQRGQRKGKIRKVDLNPRSSKAPHQPSRPRAAQRAGTGIAVLGLDPSDPDLERPARRAPFKLPPWGALVAATCGCRGSVHGVTRGEYPTVSFVVVDPCDGAGPAHLERLAPGVIGHFAARMVREVAG